MQHALTWGCGAAEGQGAGGGRGTERLGPGATLSGDRLRGAGVPHGIASPAHAGVMQGSRLRGPEQLLALPPWGPHNPVWTSKAASQEQQDKTDTGRLSQQLRFSVAEPGWCWGTATPRQGAGSPLPQPGRQRARRWRRQQPGQQTRALVAVLATCPHGRWQGNPESVPLPNPARHRTAGEEI